MALSALRQVARRRDPSRYFPKPLPVELTRFRRTLPWATLRGPYPARAAPIISSSFIIGTPGIPAGRVGRTSLDTCPTGHGQPGPCASVVRTTSPAAAASQKGSKGLPAAARLTRHRPHLHHLGQVLHPAAHAGKDAQQVDHVHLLLPRASAGAKSQHGRARGTREQGTAGTEPSGPESAGGHNLSLGSVTTRR